MSMGKLVGLCFELRNATHIAHLKTQSYAQHMALVGFYDGVIGLVDGIAESYQGRYGIITEYPRIKISEDADIVEVLKQGRSWIDKNRAEIAADSEIQNDIDTLISLFNSTLYKLQNLK